MSLKSFVSGENGKQIFRLVLKYIYYFIVFADSLVRGIQVDAYVDAHNRASSAKLGLYDFTNEHAELSEQCTRIRHQIGKISPSYKQCEITQKRLSQHTIRHYLIFRMYPSVFSEVS